MASLSRTTSRESAASSQTSHISTTDTGGQETTNGSTNPLIDDTPTLPKSPTSGPKSRTASYSLLSNALSLSGNRKSRFADVGTVGANVGRASISMPPPATKPSSTYLPSNSRRPSAVCPGNENGTSPSNMDSVPRQRSGDSAVLDDLEKTPIHAGSQGKSPSESLMLPEASLKRMLRLVIRKHFSKADSDIMISSGRRSREHK